MNLVELGCFCLQIPHLKFFMKIFSSFGDGFTASAVGLSLLLDGCLVRNEKVKWIGLAALLSIAATGLLVNSLKVIVQMPRPTFQSGYGFPSGHSGTAFSLAASIGTGFPSLGPIAYLLAVLTAISRLYFRAHFVWDVLGGTMIGTLLGISISKRLVPTQTQRSRFWNRFLTWPIVALPALVALTFFLLLKIRIAKHKLPHIFSVRSSVPVAMVDFGTPAARHLLLKGWSDDRIWRSGDRSINWVEGLYASLLLPISTVQD